MVCLTRAGRDGRTVDVGHAQGAAVTVAYAQVGGREAETGECATLWVGYDARHGERTCGDPKVGALDTFAGKEGSRAASPGSRKMRFSGDGANGMRSGGDMMATRP